MVIGWNVGLWFVRGRQGFRLATGLVTFFFIMRMRDVEE